MTAQATKKTERESARQYVVTVNDDVHAPRHKRGDGIVIDTKRAEIGDEVLCETDSGISIGILTATDGEELTLAVSCSLPTGGLFTVHANRYWAIAGRYAGRTVERRINHLCDRQEEALEA